MSEASVSDSVDDVYSLSAKITCQGSLVKTLKKSGGDAAEIAREVTKLVDLRSQLAKLEQQNVSLEPKFNRKSFDELILRKMYVVPSFEIHNGPAGLFDYGPPACSLKSNVLALWRQYFSLEENMLEMECTNLTPSAVLETSGHVDRFTDFMVKDSKTGECFRADKLLEDAIDTFLEANPHLPVEEADQHRIIQRQADAFSAEDLHDMLNKYNVKSPTNKENDLTHPFPFNLMFKTTIGPEGTSVGYLRPETAQGLFVNFRRLLDYNQNRMPFAASQIGLGFRNEIAPRNGLLRVREFCMAEIEHFVNPKDKSHPKFKKVASKELILFSSDSQLGTGRTTKITIGEAVSNGIVNNETLGYFMARTQMWLEKIGVDPSRMRFRQHLKTEMAHYAADCWDMEIKLSHGWIECVGHADRACYDLQQHSQRTGCAMVASEILPEAIECTQLIAEPVKKLIGPKFKTDQKKLFDALEALDNDEVQQLQRDLESNGSHALNGLYLLTPELIVFKSEKRIKTENKYTPSVIEPSYGIGRILYSVFEHSFSQRDGDEQRCVMAFKPCVAPIKVGIFRLVNKAEFTSYINEIYELFQSAGIANRIDSSSGTVGRRYARADELGIPFGITIDFQTLLDNSVTVRDRDTMTQVRVAILNLLPLIKSLVEEKVTWSVVLTRFMVVTVKEDDEDSKDPSSTTATTASSTVVEHSYRSAFSRPNIKK